MTVPEHVHDDQIKIWAGELIDAVTLGGAEFHPKDYENVIDIHEAAERAVRYLISNIYGDKKEAET